ncbi:cyclin-dependent kinase inhibitor [Ceratobasidium sp. AG-Ba]|nr:cyclin-dependent kinase inhibitor [Ceratobasidium sp. AG-Ba]
MKFGKQIQSQQIPGWGPYYLDYKALKKIISSLAASQAPAAMRPNDLFGLVRPSPSIDALADLKLRLATLLSKRKAAAQRSGISNVNEPNGEWRTVDEGFRLLERDLAKLQVGIFSGRVLVFMDTAQNFIELNATGFRKILKKWDKRSKSRTKELYLARQVEVQPVFNRELIAELSDTVAACLIDLTNVVVEDTPAQASIGSGDITLTQHLALSRAAQSSATVDLEGNLFKAIARPKLANLMYNSYFLLLMRRLPHLTERTSSEFSGKLQSRRLEHSRRDCCFTCV